MVLSIHVLGNAVRPLLVMILIMVTLDFYVFCMGSHVYDGVKHMDLSPCQREHVLENRWHFV